MKETLEYILDDGGPRSWREKKFEFFDTWEERDKRIEELRKEALEEMGTLKVFEGIPPRHVTIYNE